MKQVSVNMQQYAGAYSQRCTKKIFSGKSPRKLSVKQRRSLSEVIFEELSKCFRMLLYCLRGIVTTQTLEYQLLQNFETSRQFLQNYLWLLYALMLPLRLKEFFTAWSMQIAAQAAPLTKNQVIRHYCHFNP